MSIQIKIRVNADNRVFIQILYRGSGFMEVEMEQKKITKSNVTDEEMQYIYRKLLTPYKRGAVIKEENMLTDCPTIFQKDGIWYMMYTGINPKEAHMGYDTYLAKSRDLLHWERLGKVISRSGDGWDCAQRDGGLALIDIKWEGNHELHSYQGKHWATYIGGGLCGYETPPLDIGLAWTTDASEVKEWETKKEPILSVHDADVRWFEKFTLYKSFVFMDEDRTLGHPFVMFYNCKGEARMTEKIGIAVSDDMEHWMRYGNDPVIDNAMLEGNFISGDPQIYRMGDLWVMNYFIASAPGGNYTAYDTFAVSKDLLHWRKWEGKALVEPSEEWDNQFAHKPFVINWNGVVYHYYCACNTAGERFIAVAVSKEL